ncbi:MAG: tRNA (adenosine(37)-N6)-threonylcarbamoyltransferase complex ATPase subunit type 1 TsaE, partial [Lachnospiraceae bacterium]|nr:tRNA (adenosine(37)-N6)-threonylcarbamoyltransferase complex ATPase subunit type 1 TsaE [Lachnospiraceae bacterium]
MRQQLFETKSGAETYSLAKALAKEANPGEVFALIGDLGAGKTVFAKGFAAGLGIKEPVTSPTFTIVCEYEGGRIPLYHFDVYRLDDPEELFEIGFEEYLYGEGVCLIEWADRIWEELPPQTKVARIERSGTSADER